MRAALSTLLMILSFWFIFDRIALGEYLTGLSLLILAAVFFWIELAVVYKSYCRRFPDNYQSCRYRPLQISAFIVGVFFFLSLLFRATVDLHSFNGFGLFMIIIAFALLVRMIKDSLPITTLQVFKLESTL